MSESDPSTMISHMHSVDVTEAKEMAAHDTEVGSNDSVSDVKKGTRDDERDMYRMGKFQEMRVSAANET